MFPANNQFSTLHSAVSNLQKKKKNREVKKSGNSFWTYWIEKKNGNIIWCMKKFPAKNQFLTVHLVFSFKK